MKLARKTTAFLTAVCYLATSLYLSVPASAQSTLFNPEAPSQNAFYLQVPKELGTVETLQPGLAESPVVIHIQEAHANAEAQKAIYGLLEFLKKNYGFDLLLLEGNAFPLKPELLNFYPNQKKKNQEYLNELLEKGVLSGPEVFVQQNQELSGIGIESLSGFLKNAESFVHAIQIKDKAQKAISEMTQGFDKELSLKLNPELLKFLKREEAFREEKISLEAWLSEICVLAKEKMRVDLEDPRQQIQWPALTRLFTIQNFEKEIDQQVLENEKRKFVQALQHFIPGIKSFSDILASGQSPRVRAEEMVAKLPVNFAYKQFPNVSRYIGIRILQSEIEGDVLLGELERLERLIQKSLIRNALERKLTAEWKEREFLKKFFSLQLSSRDYAQLTRQNVFKEWAGIKQGVIHELFQAANQFYQDVRARDQFMLENVERHLKETGSRKVVVITGGFHSQPFEKYFKDKKYNYALISPQFSYAGGWEAYLKTSVEQFSGSQSASHSTFRHPDYSIGPEALSAQHWNKPELRPELRNGRILLTRDLRLHDGKTHLWKDGRVGVFVSGRLKGSDPHLRVSFYDSTGALQHPERFGLYTLEQSERPFYLASDQDLEILRQVQERTEEELFLEGVNGKARFEPERRKVETTAKVSPVFQSRRSGKSVELPEWVLAELTKMTKIARKLNYEAEATLYLKNGKAVGVIYPDNENKIGVIYPRFHDETRITESSSYLMLPSFAISEALKAVRGFRLPGNSEIIYREKDVLRALKGFARTLKSQEVDLDLYSVKGRKRYTINPNRILSARRLVDLSWLIEDLENLDYVVTNAVGSRQLRLRPGIPKDYDEIMTIHNHPNGQPSPPSAIADSHGTKFGDIYTPRFFQGEVMGIILDTPAGDQLFLFHETDASREELYRRAFNLYWYQNGDPSQGNAAIWNPATRSYSRSIHEAQVLQLLESELAMQTPGGSVFLSVPSASSRSELRKLRYQKMDKTQVRTLAAQIAASIYPKYDELNWFSRLLHLGKEPGVIHEMLQVVVGGVSPSEAYQMEGSMITTETLGPFVFFGAQGKTISQYRRNLREFEARVSGKPYSRHSNVIFYPQFEYFERKFPELERYAEEMIAVLIHSEKTIDHAVAVDFGSGNGILALIELLLGASEVHLMEMNSDEVAKARLLLSSKGFKENRDFFIFQGDINSPAGQAYIAKHNLKKRATVASANIGPWDGGGGLENLYGDTNWFFIQGLEDWQGLELVLNGGFQIENQHHLESRERVARKLETYGFTVPRLWLQANDLFDPESSENRHATLIKATRTTNRSELRSGITTKNVLASPWFKGALYAVIAGLLLKFGPSLPRLTGAIWAWLSSYLFLQVLAMPKEFLIGFSESVRRQSQGFRFPQFMKLPQAIEAMDKKFETDSKTGKPYIVAVTGRLWGSGKSTLSRIIYEHFTDKYGAQRDVVLIDDNQFRSNQNEVGRAIDDAKGRNALIVVTGNRIIGNFHRSKEHKPDQIIYIHTNFLDRLINSFIREFELAKVIVRDYEASLGSKILAFVNFVLIQQPLGTLFSLFRDLMDPLMDYQAIKLVQPDIVIDNSIWARRSELRSEDQVTLEQKVDMVMARSDELTQHVLNRSENAWSETRKEYGVGASRGMFKTALHDGVMEILRRYLGAPPEKLIDLGAGEAALTDFLDPEWRERYVAFDMNPNFLARAQQKRNVRDTKQGSIYDLNRVFQNQDVFVALDSFDTLENLDQALNAVYQALKPGGKLIVFQTLRGDPQGVLRGPYAQEIKRRGYVFVPPAYALFRNEADARRIYRAIIAAEERGAANNRSASEWKAYLQLMRQLEVNLNFEIFLPRMKDGLQRAGFKLLLENPLVSKAVVVPRGAHHETLLRGMGTNPQLVNVAKMIIGSAEYGLSLTGEHRTLSGVTIQIPHGSLVEDAQFLAFVAEKPKKELGEGAEIPLTTESIAMLEREGIVHVEIEGMSSASFNLQLDSDRAKIKEFLDSARFPNMRFVFQVFPSQNRAILKLLRSELRSKAKAEFEPLSKEKPNFIFLDADNFLWHAETIAERIHGEIYWRALNGINVHDERMPTEEDLKTGIELSVQGKHLDEPSHVRAIIEEARKARRAALETTDVLVNSDEEYIDLWHRRFNEMYPKHARLLDGVKAFLEAIREKQNEGYEIHLFMLSLSPKDYLETLSLHFGIRQYFEDLMGAPWEISSQPYQKWREIVGKVSSIAGGREVGLVSMAGDSTGDMNSARIATDHGVNTAAIGATTGYASRDQLRRGGAHLVVRSLHEFQTVIDYWLSPVRNELRIAIKPVTRRASFGWFGDEQKIVATELAGRFVDNHLRELSGRVFENAVHLVTQDLSVQDGEILLSDDLEKFLQENAAEFYRWISSDGPKQDAANKIFDTYEHAIPTPVNLAPVLIYLAKNPKTKYQLLVVADAFEVARFKEQLRRFSEAKLGFDPFKSLGERFQIQAVSSPSELASAVSRSLRADQKPTAEIGSNRIHERLKAAKNFVRIVDEDAMDHSQTAMIAAEEIDEMLLNPLARYEAKNLKMSLAGNRISQQIQALREYLTSA